jgi:hypothetical protein
MEVGRDQRLRRPETLTGRMMAGSSLGQYCEEDGAAELSVLEHRSPAVTARGAGEAEARSRGGQRCGAGDAGGMEQGRPAAEAAAHEQSRMAAGAEVAGGME